MQQIRICQTGLVMSIADEARATFPRILETRERILLVTDGISEAEDREGNQFGDSKLDDVAG
jgi:serine phosphatase RsbU (regulator of sigma subunit)